MLGRSGAPHPLFRRRTGGRGAAASLPVLTVALLVAASWVAGAGTLDRAAAAGSPPGSLVISEVQTGGASASDEFVELYNIGPADVDLAGLEVAYASSAGTALTRKAGWSATVTVAPGRHVLIANAAGVFAPNADATYASGLAATGGTVVLRVSGGAVLDAVGWGDATNAWVEGHPAPAPPAGSSVERRPGGEAGNGQDTNDNAADFLLVSSPTPQSLAAPPVPPSPSPSPVETPGPTEATPSPVPSEQPTPPPTPTPSATPEATPPDGTPEPTPIASPPPTASPEPSPSDSPQPSVTPSASPTPVPTPSPTATPTTRPSPSPTPTPTPSPTPTPTPSPTPTALASASPTPVPSPSPSASASPRPGLVTIAVARSLAVGQLVLVRGIVTAEPGRLIDTRTMAVQDATAGIAVRFLGEAPVPALPRGALVEALGRIGTRYRNLELRVVDGADLAVIGTTSPPAAEDVTSSDLDETTEGSLVRIEGTYVSRSATSGGGVSLLLEDPDGRYRVLLATTPADLLADLEAGASVEAVGVVAQRATSASPTGGYRVWARDAADLAVTPPDEGEAADDETSMVDASEPPPSSSPGPAGSSRPAAVRIAIGTLASRSGARVEIEGTVLAPIDFVDTTARRVVVGDQTGAALVRLLEPGPALRIGDRLRLTGRPGTYQAAPQLVADAAPSVIARGDALSPLALGRAPASTDAWRLVRAEGTIAAVHRYGATWRADVRLAGGALVPVHGTSRSGIPSGAVVAGRTATVTGIVRVPASGASDSRPVVEPRDAADLRLGGVAGGASPSAAARLAAGAGTARGGSSSGTGGAAGPWGEGVEAGGGAGSAGLSAGGDAAVPAAVPLDVDLDALGQHLGEAVRVGGLVASLGRDGFELDDGLSRVAVRLDGGASGLLELLSIGDAVNVVGRAARASSGAMEVVATSADAIERVGALGEPLPLAAVPAAADEDVTAGGVDVEVAASTRTTLGGDEVPAAAVGRQGAAMALAIGGLAACAALAALAGLAARRRRSERHLTARIAQRLRIHVAPPAP